MMGAMLRWLMVVWIGMFSVATHALVIQGKFSGYTDSSNRPSEVPIGAQVSGAFVIDTGIPFLRASMDAQHARYAFTYYDNVWPPEAYPWRDKLPITFTFNVRSASGDRVWRFNDTSYLNMSVLLERSASGQRLSLSNENHHGYLGAGISLAAPLGSLFDGLDINTLRAGPIDIDGSSAYFFRHFDPAYLDVTMRLTQLEFLPLLLPEPGALALLAFAACGAGLFIRRRRSAGAARLI